MAFSKLVRREKIKRRIRKKVSGSTEVPRLTVYRSNKQIYAQIIDDMRGVTLVSASSLKRTDAQDVAKIEQARLVGLDLAKKATAVGVKRVVFDRNGYLYHGRVKSLADAAREGGLKF
jgi:large subunit ribosomal protein L18